LFWGQYTWIKPKKIIFQEEGLFAYLNRGCPLREALTA